MLDRLREDRRLIAPPDRGPAETPDAAARPEEAQAETRDAAPASADTVRASREFSELRSLEAPAPRTVDISR